MSQTPGKGKADYLELGDSNAVCYECGRKFKASQLKRHWQGYYVCAQHWEARQPQDFVRGTQDIQTPPWVQPMPADRFIVVPSQRVVAESLGFGETFHIAYAFNRVVPFSGRTSGTVNGDTLNTLTLNTVSPADSENLTLAEVFTKVSAFTLAEVEPLSLMETFTMLYVNTAVLNGATLNQRTLG